MTADAIAMQKPQQEADGRHEQARGHLQACNKHML